MYSCAVLVSSATSSSKPTLLATRTKSSPLTSSSTNPLTRTKLLSLLVHAQLLIFTAFSHTRTHGFFVFSAPGYAAADGEGWHKLGAPLLGELSCMFHDGSGSRYAVGLYGY